MSAQVRSARGTHEDLPRLAGCASPTGSRRNGWRFPMAEPADRGGEGHHAVHRGAVTPRTRITGGRGTCRKRASRLAEVRNPDWPVGGGVLKMSATRSPARRRLSSHARGGHQQSARRCACRARSAPLPIRVPGPAAAPGRGQFRPMPASRRASCTVCPIRWDREMTWRAESRLVCSTPTDGDEAALWGHTTRCRNARGEPGPAPGHCVAPHRTTSSPRAP
jgi:hypothetical protein